MFADFQETYGICLLDYEAELASERTSRAVGWLATLAAQLPATSRVARAENPELEWTTSEYMLRQVEYAIRLLLWGLGGGDKGGPKPEPIQSPAERISHGEAVEAAEQMAATVAAVFNIERG